MNSKSKYLNNFKYLLKGFLGYIAYYNIIPGKFTPWLHYLRKCRFSDYKSDYIAPNVLIDSIYPEKIFIGKNVYLTRNTTILSHFNPTNAISEIIGNNEIIEETYIGDDVFIGVGSIVLPGVKIGKCSIVGAGSVVTKNFSDYSIIAGNPAKLIRKLK